MRSPYRPCRRKRAFDTHDDAVLALARMWANPDRVIRSYRSTGKIPCRSYECRFCGKWHLTSRPLKEAHAQ